MNHEEYYGEQYRQVQLGAPAGGFIDRISKEISRYLDEFTKGNLFRELFEKSPFGELTKKEGQGRQHFHDFAYIMSNAHDANAMSQYFLRVHMEATSHILMKMIRQYAESRKPKNVGIDILKAPDSGKTKDAILDIFIKKSSEDPNIVQIGKQASDTAQKIMKNMQTVTQAIAAPEAIPALAVKAIAGKAKDIAIGTAKKVATETVTSAENTKNNSSYPAPGPRM